MSATLLAVEILVIGYQALLWIGLGICLFPVCDDAMLETLKGWKELSIVASIVAAYTSGAIMNGIASKLMENVESKCIFKRSEKQSEMRAAILVSNSNAYVEVMKFFDVPRVLRATIFNIILIGIFVMVHLSRSTTLTCGQLILVAILFLAGAICAWWAWYETAENFYIHLSRTFDMVKRGQPSKGS